MVSVIIPTHNRQQLISSTLDSLLGQSLPDWECWVINDHSTDHTTELLTCYQQKDPRFHFFCLPQHRRGGNAARNEGCRRAQGDYLLFLDSDDLLADFCLAQRVEVMDRRPELDFVVWPTHLFEQTPGDTHLLWNRATEDEDLNRFLTLDVPWQTAGVLWRRRALEKIGPWNETVITWQDWEYHVRALAHGLTYEKFPVPDNYWRKPRRDSVSSLSSKRRYVAARLPLLLRVEKLLRRQGLFQTRQKNLLAGLFFWHAHYLTVHNRRKSQGLFFWLQAWCRRLVTTRLFLCGGRTLCRSSPQSLERFFASAPPEYRVGRSETFLKTPHVLSQPESLSG